MFELKRRDGLARTGTIRTPHGDVKTPTLMPVINPNINIIPVDEMRRRFPLQMLITNSYIIRKSESLRERALSGGLHSLIGFDGPVMTDSGTFQSHVYGDVSVTNAEIVAFQRDIGSDFGTILDVFSEPGDPREKVAEDARETLGRAREAAGLRGDMALACPVQGGVFPDLRTECAREVSAIDCGLHPVGGVVPLMESYRYADLARVILASKQGLTPARPVHLFGAGHPMMFSLAIYLGCDTFDSSSYVKYARDGRMMFLDGTRHLEEMEVNPCICPVCSGHSLDELKSLHRDGSHAELAMHNLHVCFYAVERAREAIYSGTLAEVVERDLRNHPHLVSVLEVLREHSLWLERYEEPSKGGAFFYVGPESLHRPMVCRYRQRLSERYTPPRTGLLVVLPEGERPYARHYAGVIRRVLEVSDAHFAVESPFGPVPIELDEMYPLAQSVFPPGLAVQSQECADAFYKRYEDVILWRGDESLSDIETLGRPPAALDMDLARVMAVCDMQFGRGAGKALTSGEVRIKTSRKTGKIRNVHLDGEHVLSMRAHDGLFTLKLAGGKRLHQNLPQDSMRVRVDADSVEFNLLGRNVFAKFVLDCSDDIRPRDEVLVVDAEGSLVAVGQALMNREEMLAFDTGVAVKVREGAGEGVA